VVLGDRQVLGDEVGAAGRPQPQGEPGVAELDVVAGEVRQDGHRVAAVVDDLAVVVHEQHEAADTTHPVAASMRASCSITSRDSIGFASSPP